MPARDWDAHMVANVAKEKGLKEGVQASYRVYFVQFLFKTKVFKS